MKITSGFCLVLLVHLSKWTLCSRLEEQTCAKERPHIIFIMADDAGWNDFSFHGSEIPTPNIDALAYSGMILNRYHGSPLCTPTRGALMTGKHPIHLRLQHFVIMGQSADGLPLTEKLLPEYLKEQGYVTRLVGKWHLGHSRADYTPTRRGFDSHFGYWLGKQDYYDHFSLDGGKIAWGYDFRNNLSVNYDVFGSYDTDLFTEESIRLIKEHPEEVPIFLMLNHIAPHSGNSYNPLQAPQEYIDKFDTIQEPHRRAYAAMVSKLDESVGDVIDALAEKNMLNNSLIIFLSDNGGAPEGFDLNYGSNWPLRGTGQEYLWEGGTRLVGCIWGPSIQNRVSLDTFHAQDWLPTLYQAAGGDVEELGNIDGKSMWPTFTEGKASPVSTMLYNIDDIYNNSAIQHNNWKLIQGNTSTKDLGGGIWDFWYAPTQRNSSEDLIPQILGSKSASALSSIGVTLTASKIQEHWELAKVECTKEEPIDCNPYVGPCLFNLSDDPCEQRNLADEHPKIIKELLELLAAFNETALAPIPRVKDPDALPSKWGYVWTNWKDFTDPLPSKDNN